MEKIKLRRAMELIIATSIQDFWGGGVGPEELGLSQEDMDYMSTYANEIAQKLAKGNPLNLGSVKLCIDYFRED